MKALVLFTIAVVIALLWISVLPVFSQFSTHEWPIVEVVRNPEPVLVTSDLGEPGFNSEHISVDIPKMGQGCTNDKGDGITTPMKELMITYTDLKNNTIKVYCQYNEWLGNDTRLRQYTAFYNDVIPVGMCPFEGGLNRIDIYTNQQGEIMRTHWLSIKNDATDYTIFNTSFDTETISSPATPIEQHP